MQIFDFLQNRFSNIKCDPMLSDINGQSYFNAMVTLFGAPLTRSICASADLLGVTPKDYLFDIVVRNESCRTYPIPNQLGQRFVSENNDVGSRETTKL
jgi:hypothetical protein